MPALKPASLAEPAASAGPVAAPAASAPRRHGLVRILGFSAVIGLCAWGLDRVIVSGLRRIETSKFGSFNQIVSGRINADIVINGSSRALTHYDPRVIAGLTGLSTYNIGMNGVQTDVQAAVLQTYLAHNRPPKLVIQNLEAFTFEATKAGEIYDPGLLIPYLSEPTLYEALRAIDPAVWKWKHLPLYGYAVEDMRFTWLLGLLRHVGYQGRQDYIDGFTPRHTPWTGEFEKFVASVPKGVEYPIEARGVKALTDIIRACQQRGVRIVLVFSPEYREMQAIERNRPAIFARFEALAREFGVEVWDYSGSPLCNDRANFYNSQHLNADGAHAFSADLGLRLARDPSVLGDATRTNALAASPEKPLGLVRENIRSTPVNIP